MVFLLAYAVAVWAVALIHRRRWLSFAAVAAALPPVLGLTSWAVHVWPVAKYGPPNFLYIVSGAYMALILSVGLFIAVLPRRPERACGACWYDLAGNVSGVCPECGSDITLPVAQHRAVRLKAAAALPPEASLGSRLASDTAWRPRLETACDDRSSDHHTPPEGADSASCDTPGELAA